MRLVPVLVLTLTALLPAAPATAHEQRNPASGPAAARAERGPVSGPATVHGQRGPASGPASVAAVRTAGTVWGVDPATGRLTLTADESVDDAQARVLRAVAERSAAVFRREPGRLRLLIAGGEPIYGNSAGHCSLGATVQASGTYYFVTSGHCTRAASTWYADSGRTIPLGPTAGSSFPGNDYGIVRYTGTVSHPSAVYTYPRLFPITGAGNAYVGQAVCRSGATTGVRCGTVTGLNQTVNYAEGTVFGLIRTNICAEPGDSGGPLYSASTGTILGILSGGSGNCTTGGTTYYQPITEILAAYGVTIP